MASFVEDYANRVKRIGAHPDKVLINELTKIAAEVARDPKNSRGGSPEDVVGIIEKLLLRSQANCKLPLVYLMDSILYNVRGVYQQIFSRHLISIFQSVFQEVPKKAKDKMLVLLKRWGERTGSASMDPVMLDQIRTRCDPSYRPTGPPMAQPRPNGYSAGYMGAQGAPARAPLSHMPVQNPPQSGVGGPPFAAPPFQNGPPPFNGYMGPPPAAPAHTLPPAVYQRASSLLFSLFAEMNPPIPVNQRISLDRLQMEQPALYNQVLSKAHFELANQPPAMAAPVAAVADFSSIGVPPNLSQALADAVEKGVPVDPAGLQFLQGIAEKNALHPTGQQLLVMVAKAKALGNQPGTDFSVSNLNDAAKCKAVVADLYGLGSPFGTVVDSITNLKFDSQELLVKFREKQFDLKQKLTKEAVGSKGTGLVSRMWYLNVSDWVNGESQKQDNISFFQSGNDASNVSKFAAGGRTPAEGESEEEDFAVLADDSQPNCALTGDPFESYWDDNKEEWMYKNAIRPDPNGPIYLVSAWKAKQVAESNAGSNNVASGSKRPLDSTNETTMQPIEKKAKDV